jgi:hypothetical protein
MVLGNRTIHRGRYKGYGLLILQMDGEVHHIQYQTIFNQRCEVLLNSHDAEEEPLKGNLKEPQ